MIGRINLKIQLNQSSAYIEIRLNMRRSAWMVILGLENSGGIQLQTSEEERHAISLVVILKCFLFKRPTGVESDDSAETGAAKLQKEDRDDGDPELLEDIANQGDRMQSD